MENQRMRAAFILLLAMLVCLSGCKTIEPEPVPPLPLTIPDRFSRDGKPDESPGDWWHLFGSDELNELIETAVGENFDLKIIRARIAQAKARVDKEAAALFPFLSGSFGGQKRGTQVKESHADHASYDGSHSWDGALRGSYTIDAWGEAQSDKQAEIMTLEATRQDLTTALLELTAGIAGTWVDIIATRKKMRVLEQQIKINTILLELQILRFVNGKANALDLSQQREALAETNAQVPLLEKQEQILLNNLAVLSGKIGIDPIQVKTETLPEFMPFPGVGIPSDLLENRPDIQAARLRLSSSLWTVSAAEADLLPTFELTAQALFSSGKLDLLFQNWVATLAGSIAGPIFDGGFRKAEVKRVKAVAEEQLNRYAGSVARAFFEVEDSLVSIQKQTDYIRLLEEELSVARLTLKDARIQYQNGQSSYLAFLITRTRIERLELQLVGERATLIKDRIRLCRDLGWLVDNRSESAGV